MGQSDGAEGASGRLGAAALIAEHGARLGRVCMALLGDAAEVERALEHVAREAAGKSVPADAATPRAWIFGLARAACATRLSKLPLRTNVTGPRLPEPAPSPERAMLATLRPTEREAVVLHAVGGLDAEEVAFACGVDRATARSRIAQGMAKLVEGGAR